MKTIYYLFFIICNIQVLAQPNERFWEEGDLTWSDFRGKPFISSQNASQFNFHLSYSTSKKKKGDTILFIFQTMNYMNPEVSWVNEVSKSDQLLKYNQTLFNIAELHRRKFQKELHRIESVFLADEKLRTHYENCDYEMKQFQDETQLGTDSVALSRWSEQINQQLEQNPLELIPRITDRKFGYGVNVSLGKGILTGTLSDHFSSTFNLMFGFDIAYKNTIVFLNATLAANRVKKDYIEKGLLWPEGINTNVAIMDLSVGHAFIDNAKSKFTPFVGLGIFEITAPGEGQGFKDHRLVDYSLMYGINYDYKFLKLIRIIPSYYRGFNEKVEHSIRLRSYVTSAQFANMRGASINFTIGYTIFGRMFHVN